MSSDRAPSSDGDGGLDAVELEILRNRLEGIADEMGQVLITSAYSPNIKERQDCSTALFDATGRLVAQAEHIPVHLGAMPAAVDAVLDYDPEPGDVFVLNDPFEGGTHLPDVTMVSPIATGDAAVTESASATDGIVGYAVSRAHHADVGGMTPGSMPAGARDIYQEGLRLPPTRLVRDDDIDPNVLDLVLANVRNPGERRADLRAQIAANDRGADRLRSLADEYGSETLRTAFDAVIEYSRDRMETALDDLPDGTWEASDVLEGDGVTDEDVPISVTVELDGPRIEVDFSGTAPEVAGNLNAPLAVAKSAVYFAVRCIADPEIPPNQGCYDPISIHVPPRSVLNPESPAAVVGGNVETSQRVTDVVFAALAGGAPEVVPAGGQGTMNNLTIGGRSDTIDTADTTETTDTTDTINTTETTDTTETADTTDTTDTTETADTTKTTETASTIDTAETADTTETGTTTGEGFTYYETIAGGFGGRPDADGMDGVQVGMTNTLNTPVEALEAAYPLSIERYALRPGSGGRGRYRGGLGIERAVTLGVDATVSLLTERRRTAPRGTAGGENGAVGKNLIDGEEVPGKTTREVTAGSTVTVLTPGGGGHGDPAERTDDLAERDRADGKTTGRD